MMKELIFTLLFLLVPQFTLCAESPTPFSDNVSEMWLKGNKAGVLAIANQRLQSNPNDLAGLLLTTEYQMEYADLANIKTTMDKVIAVGGNVSTGRFASLYKKLKQNLLYMESLIPKLAPQITPSERAKGDIPGKPLNMLEHLQALELDGFIH